MSVQVAMTSLLSMLMAAGLMMAGLPPVAYTIPARLAVFIGEDAGLGGPGTGHRGGFETMARRLSR